MEIVGRRTADSDTVEHIDKTAVTLAVDLCQLHRNELHLVKHTRVKKIGRLVPQPEYLLHVRGDNGLKLKHIPDEQQLLAAERTAAVAGR